MSWKAGNDPAPSAVSEFERRAQKARLCGSRLCEYSENVPKWRQPMEFDDRFRCDRYPSASGSEELRAGVIAREGTRYGLRLTLENVLITNGALHGLSLIFRALRRPILCQAPVFHLVPEQIRSSRLPIEYFRLCEWTDRVTQICNSARSGDWAVYLNIPSNPFGECPNKTQPERIITDCGRHGWKIICDMVYDEFSFVGPHPLNALSLTDQWKNVFVVNSFSKNYGAPGLRVGWIESAQESIRFLRGALERDCIAVNEGAQHAAVSLLAHGNQELLDTVVRGREITRALASRYPTLRLVVPPAGTLLIWEGDFGCVTRFADYMLHEWNVLISTSENYTSCAAEHVRLPTGYPENTIRRAVDLIGRGYVDWLGFGSVSASACSDEGHRRARGSRLPERRREA